MNLNFHRVTTNKKHETPTLGSVKAKGTRV